MRGEKIFFGTVMTQRRKERSKWKVRSSGWMATSVEYRGIHFSIHNITKKSGLSNRKGKFLAFFHPSDLFSRPRTTEVCQSLIYFSTSVYIACKFYFLKFLFKSHLSLFVSKNKSRIGIKEGRGNGKNKISLYIHTSNPSPLYFIEHPIERFNPSCQIPPVHKTRNRIAQHPWKRWNTPSTSSTSFFFLFLSRLPLPSQPQSLQSYHSARHANSRGEKFSLLENNGIFR